MNFKIIFVTEDKQLVSATDWMNLADKSDIVIYAHKTPRQLT